MCDSSTSFGTNFQKASRMLYVNAQVGQRYIAEAALFRDDPSALMGGHHSGASGISRPATIAVQHLARI